VTVLLTPWHVVAAATFTPADDPFAITLEDFKRDQAVNLESCFVAAKEAVAGFKELPASASRTFVYTGNVLNVAMIPQFLSAGAGKAGGAYMMQTAADAYKEAGYK
jgi:hypothetical protein